MAVGVVELLEVIDVEHRDRHRLTAGLHGLGELYIPCTAVGQAGERVGQGLVGELLDHVGAVDHGRDLTCEQ